MSPARLSYGMLLLISSCVHLPAQQPSSDLPTLELTGGRWFNGRGFESRSMYSTDGILQKLRPTDIDEVIDLENGYVVPPYGEAHTHRPASPGRFQQSSTKFLRDGVFYVMNHGNLARYLPEFASLTSDPLSIDARFAGAVIASPQSHGVELWQRLVERGSFPGVTSDSLPGDAWFVVDSKESLLRQWPQFLKTKPDFVKIMVEYSEDYVTRHDDKTFFGRSGLHPKLVPQIVTLAHDAGLRVSAHIETAADFHVVVDAGVDLVAHLPGYDIPIDADDRRYQIDPADAARAKQQDTVVITTTILGVDRADGDERRLKKIQRNQQHNLKLLSQAGVSIAVGSDQFSTNSVDEALNLSALGVFDNLTLLDMLCRVTPRSIFPERKIGALEDGCEASFLVLRQNPLDDLQHLRGIKLRCKSGRFLDKEAATPTDAVNDSAGATQEPISNAGQSQNQSQHDTSSPPALVITNCRVVSVRDGRILPNQMVVIERGLISSTRATRRAGYPKLARVIDGTDKFVIPGLVDMHVHLGHESELTSYLLHGVTTICNLGGDYVDLFSDDMIDICKLRAQVASGEVTGPRIYTAGQALDGQPRTGPFQRALSGPAAAVEAVLDQKRRGFDFIKVYDALDEATLKAIVRAAAESDLAVIGHIPEKPGVDKTLRSGIHLIAHAEEFYPAFEGVEDFEATARKLAERVKESGVSVTPNTAFIRRLIAQLEDLPTVLSDERVNLLAPRVRRWWTPEYNYYTRRENADQFLVDTKRKYQWLIPFVRELQAAGVPLITGTDSSIPGALPGYSILEEFRDLQSAGLTPLEILQTTTLNPARFLQKHASSKPDLGEVRQGCLADLLLLDKNPLQNMHILKMDEAVVGVVFNGRYKTRKELHALLLNRANEF